MVIVIDSAFTHNKFALSLFELPPPPTTKKKNSNALLFSIGFAFLLSHSCFTFLICGLHFLKGSYYQSSFHFAFSIKTACFNYWILCSYIFSGCIFIYRSRKMLAQIPFVSFSFWQLGLIIRAVTSGHLPPYTFILVTMGTTAVLLIGWRALLFSILPDDKSKKNDVYRRGNPFELFEVWAFSCLTHAVRFE